MLTAVVYDTLTFCQAILNSPCRERSCDAEAHLRFSRCYLSVDGIWLVSSALISLGAILMVRSQLRQEANV